MILIMEKGKETKGAKPVYISVPKLEKLIQIASNHPNSVFNSKYFEQYSFGGSDATLAVSSLRFLGLIGEEGQATNLMAKISAKNPERRKQGFDEVVRGAYSKLFEGETKPYELSSDDLYDELRGQYDLSPRVTRTAVPAFLKLCEYAGLKEETKAPVMRKRTKTAQGPKDKGERQQEKSGAKVVFQKPGLIQIMAGEINIAISEEVAKRQIFDKDFRHLIDGLIDAAHKVEEKFQKEAPDSGKESGAG